MIYEYIYALEYKYATYTTQLKAESIELSECLVSDFLRIN